jgi:glucose/arabinose dehydrogenase
MPQPQCGRPAPAFPQQTRAPYAPSNVALTVETLAEGLAFPWGLALLPDGRFLVTEKAGTMRIVSGGTLSAPVAGLPPVTVQEISGLDDVILDPDSPATGVSTGAMSRTARRATCSPWRAGGWSTAPRRGSRMSR